MNSVHPDFAHLSADNLSNDDILRLMRKAAEAIPPSQLWVNPDCGLKTHAWPETRAALRNMVEAAKVLRRVGTCAHAAIGKGRINAHVDTATIEIKRAR